MDVGTAVFRPLRWLAHLPLAMLPFLAAAIEGPRMQRDVERRAAAALAESGAGWARVTANGRDLVLRGLAPDQAARETARATASAVSGVRRVDMRAGAVSP